MLWLLLLMLLIPTCSAVAVWWELRNSPAAEGAGEGVAEHAG